MLDKQLESMLQAASELTAEDLDYLRTTVPAVSRSQATTHAQQAMPTEAPSASVSPGSPTADTARGARERQRTRASKIATACTGQPRIKHEWWPIGTELVGRMRDQVFTAEVVENPQVKSNRSLRITMGPAQGAICITPTRAALEATEAFRQENGLGRGGGVTNGWTFWKTAP